MSNNQHFFKFHFSIMNIQDLSLMDKVVYCVISSLANKTGICTASNSYIAEQLKVSRRTIENSFKNLRDIKLIETSLIFEEGTKRILKRNTKIVPLELYFDTETECGSVSSENVVGSHKNECFDTATECGDNRYNTIDKNNRDKAVATLPFFLSSNDKEEDGNLDASNSKPKQTKKTDTSYHFKQLNELALELKTKKDGRKHHPFKVIKEFDEYLQDYPYETQEEKEIVHEILDVGYRFIRYRDERFNLTKDKGFGLLTIKAITNFIQIVFEDYGSTELDDLFERLEVKGWITIQKGWKL